MTAGTAFGGRALGKICQSVRGVTADRHRLLILLGGVGTGKTAIHRMRSWPKSIMTSPRITGSLWKAVLSGDAK